MTNTPESAVRYDERDNIAVLTIDFPPVNVLGAPVRDGLMMRLRQAQADERVCGVVVIGAQDRFVAGADIRELGAGLRGATLADLTRQMEASTKPIVAAIDGYALGGGLELALGAGYRIAHVRAKLGFPEINLGLLPGGGGTQRGTRLMGPAAALDLMTSGRSVSAHEALDLGLIDEVTDGELLSAAISLARRKGAEENSHARAIDRRDRIAEVTPDLFSDFRRRNSGKWRGMIAPFKIVDCIEAATTLAPQEGLAFEREAFRLCKETPAHPALVHLFFAERGAARINGIDPATKPRPIHSVAVIGAGTMGGGIAMTIASAGLPVILMDATRASLDAGLDRIKSSYSTSIDRGSMQRDEVDRALARISATMDYAEIAHCDLVIEAVFEDLTIKKDLFARLDALMKPGAVLATNTSALDIDEIAAATSRPRDVVGLHFFSPANVMKLLEVVRGLESSDEIIVTAMAFARRLGKVAVLARNAEGFIGNRILRSYGREADFLLEEGASPWQIDSALKDFGFPMGLYLMRDMAGMDVGWKSRIARGVRTDADDYHALLWDRLCEQGRFGQKTGAGYYRYDGRNPFPDPAVDALLMQISRDKGIERRSFSNDEIIWRILCAMVNEGARVLEEGVAQRAGDIDVAYVYGYGFPKYRGGPLFWAQREGLSKILLEVKRQHAKAHRWKPAALLEKLVAEGSAWDG